MNGGNDRFFNETGDYLESVRNNFRIGAHALDRIEIESAREDGQPRPQDLFFRRAEIEAPIDGATQRLMPHRSATVSPRQQIEKGALARQDAVEGKGPDPDRCEFDSQRDAVQPLAQAGNLQAALIVEGVSGDDGCSALLEKIDRLGMKALAVLSLGELSFVQNRQGRYLEHGLPQNTERLPTGCQDLHAVRPPNNLGGDASARLDQVLAVVQDDECMSFTEEFEQVVTTVRIHSVSNVERSVIALTTSSGVEIAARSTNQTPPV